MKDHAGFVASIRLQLDGKHPLAVFLDTLNRSLHGSESNDEDMTAYIRAADAIRDAFNCAVIVVHHCGIEGTRPRGHTALAGAVDAQIAVKRDTADNIVVTVERMKDGPEGDTIVSALEVVEVGLDDDGDAITSCVVVAADPSERAPNAKKLPASAQIALDLLKRAIADEGKVAPANNHIPSGSRTIRSDLWRAYCDRGMLSQSDKPDSRLKAFVRASEKLQERGLIGVWSDHVWLAGQPGQ